MSLQIWNRLGRIFFMVTIAVAAMLAVQSQAGAATCKAVFHEKSQFDDGTPITGIGSSVSAAFEDAVTRCFDHRAAKATGRSSSVNEEIGRDIIDSCVNLTCG